MYSVLRGRHLSKPIALFTNRIKDQDTSNHLAGVQLIGEGNSVPLSYVQSLVTVYQKDDYREVKTIDQGIILGLLFSKRIAAGCLQPESHEFKDIY